MRFETDHQDDPGGSLLTDCQAVESAIMNVKKANETYKSVILAKTAGACSSPKVSHMMVSASFSGNDGSDVMDKSLLAKISVGLLLGAAVVGSASAQDRKGAAFTGERYIKEANISLDEARAIALKIYAGEIVTQELEKEKGGSGLRYSFDIKNGKVTHEVGVDAKTGKVLENSAEGARHD